MNGSNTTSNGVGPDKTISEMEEAENQYFTVNSPPPGLASHLTPLRALRLLRLNPDSPEFPGPRVGCPRLSITGNALAERQARLRAAARARARALADALAPGCTGLEAVALLVHDAVGSWWLRCPVGRDGEGDEERAEEDWGMMEL